MKRLPSAPELATVAEQFTKVFLPAVTGHANKRFRGDLDREDRVAEAVGHAWALVRALHLQGRPWKHLVGAIAKAAVGRVFAGRRVAGVGSGKRSGYCDPYAKCRRHGLGVAEDRTERRAEDVALRMDLEAFLPTLAERDAAVIQALAEGERVGRLAQAEGVPHGAIVQVRYRVRRQWQAFQGQ